MFTFPVLPFLIKNGSSLLYSLFGYDLNIFSYFLRTQLAPFRPSKLVRETVGTEVNRIACLHFNLGIGEFVLIFKNTTADGEFISLDFFHNTAYHGIHRTMGAGVF